jgi:hypothetical protein
LPQEVQAGRFKQADVFDAVFHHDQPVDAAAPGEAGVNIGIDTRFMQDVWVDQAAAQQLDPAGLAADIAAFFIAKWAAQGELE